MVIILITNAVRLGEFSQRFFADWNSATVLYSTIIIIPRGFVLLIGLKFNGPKLVLSFSTQCRKMLGKKILFSCKKKSHTFLKQEEDWRILVTRKKKSDRYLFQFGFMTKLTLLKFHQTLTQQSSHKKKSQINFSHQNILVQIRIIAVLTYYPLLPKI